MMWYFVAWVLLAATALLAVPIVHFVEQARLKKVAALDEPDGEGDGEDWGDDAVAVEDGQEAMPEEPEGLSEFGEGVPVGEDDFSAFDEEFK